MSCNSVFGGTRLKDRLPFAFLVRETWVLILKILAFVYYVLVW